MVSSKYVTKMIPFWQKVWILLKDLLLLFILENLPVANKSEPLTGIIPSQACPSSGTFFHQDHLLWQERVPSTTPCLDLGRGSWRQRQGLDFYLVCWALHSC